MPKKGKRNVSTYKPKAEVAAKVSSPVSTRTSSTEFNPDYGYVLRDLKRIGVLAGSFFVILIVLAIFLG